MEMNARCRALDKIYKRRDRYEIPDWQRERVWPKKKKQLLIDSILRGWKLPKFYFVKVSDNPEEFIVVDGQQRLATIFEFFDNVLSLSNESAKKYGAHLYKELPETISDKFDDFEIEYDEILEVDDTESKEFFRRLQEGMQLTGSEKLNSVHSKLRDFCKSLAQHSFFSSKIHVHDTRFAHFDIMSKVAAIELDGLDTGLRYEELKETFESHANFSRKSNVAKKLRRTLDYLDRVFSLKSQILRNRTIAQSFVTAVSNILEHSDGEGHEDRLKRFFEHFARELSRQVELGQDATDGNYLDFQKTVNANVKSGARTRQNILMRKLLVFDPTFASVLDSTTISASGLSSEVHRLAESILELVHSINEGYAAKNGDDLFKATNKTSQALTQLGKPTRNYSDYKTLIENLYFVFHEGPGNRLSGHTPQSFQDINDLRTANEHDVDHGKAGKVRAKRKKLSATFGRYGADASPKGLAPEKFVCVQANLLQAIENDLRKLYSSPLIAVAGTRK